MKIAGLTFCLLFFVTAFTLFGMAGRNLLGPYVGAVIVFGLGFGGGMPKWLADGLHGQKRLQEINRVDDASQP